MTVDFKNSDMIYEIYTGGKHGFNFGEGILYSFQLNSSINDCDSHAFYPGDAFEGLPTNWLMNKTGTFKMNEFEAFKVCVTQISFI